MFTIKLPGVSVCNSEKLHINLMLIGQFVKLKLLTNYMCKEVLIRKKIHGLHLFTQRTVKVHIVHLILENKFVFLCFKTG